MRLSVVLALLLLPAAARKELSASLAQKLARLRSEVEALSAELSAERARAREELLSLRSRAAELEAEIQRERLRKARLEEAIREEREAVLEAARKEQDLVPAVKEAAARLKTSIQEGLPFRTPERLAAVDEINRSLEGGTLRPSQAAQRLWSLVQDEVRLTRESGLYRQPIVFDGEEHLVDVVRVGMVMLFFRTADGRTGRAERRDGQWRFVVLEDPDEIDEVNRLFAAFERQIRTGLFRLPAAPPEEEIR